MWASSEQHLDSESGISASPPFGSVNSLFSSTNNPNLAFKSLCKRRTEGSFFPTLASLSQRIEGKQIHTIRRYCATRSRCNELKHEFRSPCSFSFAANIGHFYMFIRQQRYALRRHRLQKETVKIIILKKYQFPSAEEWEGSRLTTASPEPYLTGAGRSTSSQAWSPSLWELNNATSQQMTWATMHETRSNVKGKTHKELINSKTTKSISAQGRTFVKNYLVIVSF